MYLAYGYRKRHSYDADTMDVMEYKMGEHIGLLLVYELPDTVKQQRTEAQAYAAGYHDETAKGPAAFLCLLRTGFFGR